jgi:hypothetical protein
LLDETRKELATRKASGLIVKAFETRVRQAADDVDAAARRLDSSPSEALQLAQTA